MALLCCTKSCVKNLKKLSYNFNLTLRSSKKNYSNLVACRCLTSNLFSDVYRANYIDFRSLFLSCPLMKKARVSITFMKDGKKYTGIGKEGESLLDVVVNNDLDIEGYGACEGTLSCSTCHVIFKPEDFAQIPDKATDEELDMLDLAPDYCETSRLGCQISITKDMEGLTVTVPAAVRDLREFPPGTDASKA
ncbi:adrenodoxin-like protein 2, mitochondrial isoform X1 [Stegodyphus dumicola]|uniref:adrenodoxin-like protein 2, mitochondrial isoform X1 n=1 Tax=Stegodyphus dumicola TaxID=202533 RepID=UPI0015AE51D6|nr:adrenodoxin-like protein 2, mitochondrial isoform X1 [Stegodyphus dumicola]